VDGAASIAEEIIARYAADAAREVPGVRALSGRRGVKVLQADGKVDVELHLQTTWGASIPEIALAVQGRVAEYLEAMANVAPRRVEIVIESVGPVE
jgi:uncharacterized alkaline shock family protein YloU